MRDIRKIDSIRAYFNIHSRRTSLFRLQQRHRRRKRQCRLRSQW